MTLYVVVEWDGSWSVIELNVGDPTSVITGTPVAECCDPEQAHRIARLLADDARDRAEMAS